MDKEIRQRPGRYGAKRTEAYQEVIYRIHPEEVSCLSQHGVQIGSIRPAKDGCIYVPYTQGKVDPDTGMLQSTYRAGQTQIRIIEQAATQCGFPINDTPGLSGQERY